MSKDKLALIIGAALSTPGFPTEEDVINPELTIHWLKPQKESKQLDGYSYDEKSKVLALKFKNGNIYIYEQVPKDAFDTLLTVDHAQFESLGSWVYQNITAHKELYPYKKVVR